MIVKIVKIVKRDILTEHLLMLLSSYSYYKISTKPSQFKIPFDVISNLTNIQKTFCKKVVNKLA